MTVAQSLFVWWTSGVGRSAVVSYCLVDLVCWTVLSSRETQEEQLGVSRRNWCDLGFSRTCCIAEFPQSHVDDE